MQETYMNAIIWYALWPLLIYLSYRFVLLNLRHYTKMERLEELEAKYSRESETNISQKRLQ